VPFLKVRKISKAKGGKSKIMVAASQNELEQQIQQAQQQYDQEVYQQLVNKYKPKPTVFKNSIWAFIVGGLICTLAQVILSLFLSLGLAIREANSATVIVMIFLGAFLTGLGVYDNLARFGGAGAIVPITGFANSIVSPALEFKREGFIFGVGSRMFIIAGPVLVYGFILSVLVGLIAYFLL
jgi:stage V sporulation protein AC